MSLDVFFRSQDMGIGESLSLDSSDMTSTAGEA